MEPSAKFGKRRVTNIDMFLLQKKAQFLYTKVHRKFLVGMNSCFSLQAGFDF